MFRHLPKEVEVSLGLLVGYMLMAFLNSIYSDSSFVEALKDIKIIMLVAGIALSYWLFVRKKRKDEDQNAANE